MNRKSSFRSVFRRGLCGLCGEVGDLFSNHGVHGEGRNATSWCFVLGAWFLVEALERRGVVFFCELKRSWFFVLSSWLSREDVRERVLAMATFHRDDSPTCDASRTISEVSLAKSSESSCRREIFACCIAFSRKWMRGLPSHRAAIPDVSLLSLNNAMADCCLIRSPNWRAFK